MLFIIDQREIKNKQSGDCLLSETKMIQPPNIQLDFFQKLVILIVIAFGGAIMFNIHRIIDWLRDLDNQ